MNVFADVAPVILFTAFFIELKSTLVSVLPVRATVRVLFITICGKL